MTAASAAGTHALAWYFGLLALLLTGERFAFSAHARWRWNFHDAQAGSPVVAVRLGLGVALVMGAAICFAVIAYITRDGAFAQADQVFLGALQASMPSRVVRQFAWITWLGDARTLTLLCGVTVAVLLGRGERALAVAMLVAAGGNGIFNTAMKHLFARSCPRHEVTLPLGHSVCFPSGHTSGAIAAYGMLTYMLLRALPTRWHLPVLTLATALIYSVACSRVFVSAHYPSDVLGGVAWGITWLAAVVVVTECWLRGWRPLAPQQRAARQLGMPD